MCRSWCRPGTTTLGSYQQDPLRMSKAPAPQTLNAPNQQAMARPIFGETHPHATPMSFCSWPYPQLFTLRVPQTSTKVLPEVLLPVCCSFPEKQRNLAHCLPRPPSPWPLALPSTQAEGHHRWWGHLDSGHHGWALKSFHKVLEMHKGSSHFFHTFSTSPSPSVSSSTRVCPGRQG